jgi:hypothetical protein
LGLMYFRGLVLVVVVWACVLVVGGLAAPVAFAEGCPNEAARSGASAGLPECRAYEMVTPVDKSGIVEDLTLTNEDATLAVDGDRVVMYASSVVGWGNTPEPFESLVEFVRTPSGWETESFNPPGSDGFEYGSGLVQTVFSPDLTEGLVFVSDENLLPRSLTRYVRFGPPGGPFTTIATMPTPANLLAGVPAPEMSGATPSFGSLFFEAYAPDDHELSSPTTGLVGTPVGSAAGAAEGYEWREGRLRPLDEGEDGALLSACGTSFNAVAEDGSRVIFRTPSKGYFNRELESSPPASCGESEARLWLREGSRVIEISKPNPGVAPEGHRQVEFKGASLDGSKVFFTTAMELTKSDEGYHDEELYEYDAETGTLTRISGGATGTLEGRVGNVWPAKDGSKVYFTSADSLVLGAPPGLYVYNTITGETRYVGGFPSGNDETHSGEEGEEQGGHTRTFLPSYPGGKYVAIFNQGPLAGTVGSQKGTEDNGWQAFLYDYETSELRCVSCLPEGSPMSEPYERGWGLWAGARLWTWDNSSPPWSMVSENGNMFFESSSRLVPKAVNVDGGGLEDGEETTSDVYEWRDGVVSLISSPDDSFRQRLLGTTPSGDDVFFLSHARLVPQDIDGSGDIYDARVDGGFPPLVESAACQGDTCVIPPPALNDPTPGSLSFTGPGNPPIKVLEPKQARCRDSQMLEHGKCVRKRIRSKARRATRRAKKPAQRARRATRRAARAVRGVVR